MQKTFQRILFAGCALLPILCTAQTWPARPIRMVVGFAAGGPTDLVSRVIAQKLSERLGQQVFIDNKPGAGGTIAIEMVARAPADGYTVLYGTSSLVIAPALYHKVNYDPVQDLSPVLLTAAVPLVFVVNPNVPATSLKEFVGLVQSQPGKFNYSSSGAGTITHLVPAMFLAEAKLKAQHIPYKGSAPGLLDVAAGQTQFMIDTINTVLPYVRDNRIRPLAVTTLKRSALLPEVPTLAELGYEGFNAAAWQGVMVPVGTPRPVIDRLNAEINQVLKLPAVKATLAEQGAEILGGTPEEYAAFIQTEIPRWNQAVQLSGAKEN